MRIFFVLITAACCLVWSCKKESFTTSGDANIITGEDTLRFDTVFTTLGSITQAFTIVNDNDQKLRISNIHLGGGDASFFKINVDGTPGTDFNNIELNANDSMYVFVKVTIDPSVTNQPFVVNDSITISYNGNSVIKQLQAYGQNAHFISTPTTIASNTTWTNEKPYVILKTLTVDQGVTLTLEKGTRVYCNATAGFVVNGNLICNGEVEDSNRIIFRGDRLDVEYRDLPAGWPGIEFGPTSFTNKLTYTNILNAYRGIISNSTSIALESCIIDNAYDFGLFAANSTVQATNCLISQCGNEGTLGNGGSNVILTAGGSYNFAHCTFVTYSNLFQNHKQPVLYVADNFDGVNYALTANFYNSIIYGEGGFAEDELVVNTTPSPSSTVLFQNVLYKTKTGEVPNATFAGEILKENPIFDTVNTSRREYNFRLRDTSPAIDKGEVVTGISNDLDGNERVVNNKPDLGCYEKQP